MAGHGLGSGTARAAGDADSWEIYSASAIGADHVRARMPNQDGVRTERLDRADGSSLPVFAVADGHGHIRHFRSDRGSRFAVTAACSVAGEWAAALPAGEAPAAAAASRLVSQIVVRWRELVAGDLASDPITAVEAVAVMPDDPPEIPYGSTLLIGVLTPQVAVLGQIGDGEIVLVLPDGRELSPVPTDSRLDGTATTSLCQPDAVSSFRVALVPLTRTPVFGVFASTDGYSNAQAEANWRQSLAADLVHLASTNGTAWIGRELPGWAATCASSDGSGDDTTVALMLNASVRLAPPAEQWPEPRSPFADGDATLAYETIPAAAGTPQDGRDTAGATSRVPVSAEPPTRPIRAAAGTGYSPGAAPANAPFAAGSTRPRRGRDGQGPRGQPPGAAGLVMRPQVWLPALLVLGLAVVMVVIFSSHLGAGKSPIPRTGATTFPSSQHKRSASPSASPATRNSAIPAPTPTSAPAPPVNPATGREVGEPMANHGGFSLPLPPVSFPVPLPSGVTIPPRVLNAGSAEFSAAWLPASFGTELWPWPTYLYWRWPQV